MPHLDFPDTPTGGQVFTQTGASWVWDGVKWTSAPLPDTYSVNTLTPVSGATVTLADFRPVFVNTGALAALTVKLPPSPANGNLVDVSFLSSVTSLAIQDSSGTLVPSSPTNAFGPGAGLEFRFCSAGWVYWK